MQRFVCRLKKRVDRLEAELPSDESHIFADALDDPECYLLTRKALLAASATDNDDRHEVLCELIAQRLSANQDDLIALTGQAACDVINALSSKHIKLLALMAALQRLRPQTIPEITSQAQFEQFLFEWWNNSLTGICPPEIIELKRMDMSHLIGLSCAVYIPVMTDGNDLISVLSLGIKGSNFGINPSMLARFKEFEWWRAVQHVISMGGQLTILTGIGTLIGVIHYDSVKNTQTKLDW